MAPAIDRLNVRGVSVRIFRAGTGASVLFLHGGGGLPDWLPFFERVMQRYALTVPEHPGFGVSNDPPWLRSISDLAMYYLDFLDQVYGSPTHVIGHSLGGWAAAEAAVRNTRCIASLTLIAPAGIRIKGLPPGDIFIWSAEEFARNRIHDQGLTDWSIKGQPSSEADLNIQLQNNLARVKFGWEPRLFNPDLEKWLHRITVPTHIVWGRDDQILPGAYAELWAKRVPDAHVSMIDACGHAPHIEKTGLVSDKVFAFLDRVQA